MGRRPSAGTGLCLFAGSILIDDGRGVDARLVVEIAEKSLQAGGLAKGPKYRPDRVEEDWLINVQASIAPVHRLDGGWPIEKVAYEAPLGPMLVSGVRLNLAESRLSGVNARLIDDRAVSDPMETDRCAQIGD